MTEPTPLPVVVDPKPWYRSATVWTNVAAFIAAAVPLVVTYTSTILGEETALQISAGLGIANALLQLGVRVFVTKAPIAGSPVVRALRRVA